MKNILFFVAGLLLAFPLRAQFQPSSVQEVLIPGSENPGAHISNVNCYSYGNLPFSGVSCDLYVSTWRNQSTSAFYYKRTHATNPSAVINEGVVTVPNAAVIYDAVIVRNITPGSPNPFGVAVVSGTNPGGWITFYEWTPTVSGSDQTISVYNRLYCGYEYGCSEFGILYCCL